MILHRGSSLSPITPLVGRWGQNTGYHVSDVVRGIEATVRLLEAGRDDLPPIHLAGGRATTLGDLAQMANAAGGGRSRVDQVDNHAFNVSCFVGDPRRAREVLGWRAEIPLPAGVHQLVADFCALRDGGEGAAGCSA